MKFADQIRRHTKEYERRMGAVFRQSAQEVANKAREPRAKGGRLPVDTGFLRASAGAGINEMPSGPTSNEGGAVTNRVTGMGLTEALGRWKPGDTFFFGFSALYARFMETRYGFVRGAAEKWSSIVAKNANLIRRR